MNVWTDLERDDLERIAADNHVQLHEHRGPEEMGHGRDGRNHHRFTIRPAAGDETYRKQNPINGRRVWAVCWHGHFAFLAGLFKADPGARVKSAVADWRGQDDFWRRAPDTAGDMQGSVMYPYCAAEACAGNHGVEWLSPDDAYGIGRHALAR